MDILFSKRLFAFHECILWTFSYRQEKQTCASVAVCILAWTCSGKIKWDAGMIGHVIKSKFLLSCNHFHEGYVTGAMYFCLNPLHLLATISCCACAQSVKKSCVLCYSFPFRIFCRATLASLSVVSSCWPTSYLWLFYQWCGVLQMLSKMSLACPQYFKRNQACGYFHLSSF